MTAKFLSAELLAPRHTCHSDVSKVTAGREMVHALSGSWNVLLRVYKASVARVVSLIQGREHVM